MDDKYVNIIMIKIKNGRFYFNSIFCAPFIASYSLLLKQNQFFLQFHEVWTKNLLCFPLGGHH